MTRARKIGFACVPLLALLALGELGVRVARGRVFTLENARAAGLAIQKQAYPAVYDATLGYRPTPGSRTVSSDGVVTIDRDGFRASGAAGLTGTPILAVGDSFTFGAEVSDADAWPAKLETGLGRPVINAGVFGYGLDQAVLRMKACLSAARYEVVILGLIADDVDRCEMASRYSWKPYFEAVDSPGPDGVGLVLRNVPVPRVPLRAGWGKDVLGRSFLADAVFSRTVPAWWSANIGKVRAHRRGPEVAARLLRLAKAAADANGARLILLVQSGADPEGDEDAKLAPLVAEAKALAVPTVDVRAALASALREEPSRRAAWFVRYHMSAAGNAWVAERLAAVMRESR